MKYAVRTPLVVAALAVGLLLAPSCVEPTGARVSARVQVPAPLLIEISPGLWVVEDHDQPVFYYDGWYWLYSNGAWLRSPYYTGSFVRVRSSIVPRPLTRIHQPRRYIRYSARPGVRVRRAPPTRSKTEVRVDRDRRGERATPRERERRGRD